MLGHAFVDEQVRDRVEDQHDGCVVTYPYHLGAVREICPMFIQETTGNFFDQRLVCLIRIASRIATRSIQLQSFESNTLSTKYGVFPFYTLLRITPPRVMFLNFNSI